MKLICIVKFVPDVDRFQYDFERSTLIRDQVRLTLNPDDACALAFALKLKAKRPDTRIEVVTMAPISVIPHMEDILRLGVDQGTLLSDKSFAGSDTYATSLVLARYISGQACDCILTGTHAVDGDTSHVPAQLGERLGLNQLSNVIRLEEDMDEHAAVATVEHEWACVRYEVMLPAILSLSRECGCKLPYVRRGDMNSDVRPRLRILNRQDLGLEAEQTGQRGSLTRVAGTYAKHYEKRDQRIVKVDDAGIEAVFDFLRDKGYV